MTTDPTGGLPTPLLQKLESARNNLRLVAYLSVMGGVFSLVFMLLMAYQLGNAFLSLTNVSFLTGGAVAFALGLGLLSFSEGARAAGAGWFLAWGAVMLVVGIFAAWRSDLLLGVFCLVSAVCQLVFAALLHRPAEVFLTAYCAGELEPKRVEEAVMKAYSEPKHKALHRFLDTYREGEETAVEELPGQ